MKIIDAATENIIAAIMTVQTATKMTALANDHPVAAIPPMAIPAMPSGGHSPADRNSHRHAHVDGLVDGQHPRRPGQYDERNRQHGIASSRGIGHTATASKGGQSRILALRGIGTCPSNGMCLLDRLSPVRLKPNPSVRTSRERPA